MLAGPSLVVDQVAPPFSVAKTPTEVAAYSHEGRSGWRFTSNTGAAGRLPVIEDHVAPPSSVCQTLFGVKPVKATITCAGLARAISMRMTRRAGSTPAPTRVHAGAWASALSLR